MLHRVQCFLCLPIIAVPDLRDLAAAIEQIDDYRAVTAQAKGVPAIRPDVDRPRREKICNRAANEIGSLELAGIGSVNHRVTVAVVGPGSE